MAFLNEIFAPRLSFAFNFVGEILKSNVHS